MLFSGQRLLLSGSSAYGAVVYGGSAYEGSAFFSGLMAGNEYSAEGYNFIPVGYVPASGRYYPDTQSTYIDYSSEYPAPMYKHTGGTMYAPWANYDLFGHYKDIQVKLTGAVAICNASEADKALQWPYSAVFGTATSVGHVTFYIAGIYQDSSNYTRTINCSDYSSMTSNMPMCYVQFGRPTAASLDSYVVPTSLHASIYNPTGTISGYMVGG